MNKFFTVSLLMAIALILSPEAEAFKETDRHVNKLSETLTLHTISYEFRLNNADVWLPIMMASTTVNNAVGLKKTSSLFLSTAVIEGKSYYIPTGEKGSFTLLVLEEHDSGKSGRTVTINSLPITIQKNGEEKQLMVLQSK
jgi:hypothetical protein